MFQAKSIIESRLYLLFQHYYMPIRYKEIRSLGAQAYSVVHDHHDHHNHHYRCIISLTSIIYLVSFAHNLLFNPLAILVTLPIFQQMMSIKRACVTAICCNLALRRDNSNVFVGGDDHQGVTATKGSLIKKDYGQRHF